VLLKVTLWLALVEPNPCWAKVSVVALKLAVGITPVPLSATVCGDPVALSATLIVPVMLPVDEGLNATDTKHCAPASRFAPVQPLPVIGNCVVSEVVTAVIFSAVLPVFVTLKFSLLLCVFSYTP
jgi:type III secretory pathway component EscR